MQKFSVAMCVYGKDNPTWFKIAVDSVNNQTVKPDEIIIVVDGSVPKQLDDIICQYENEAGFKIIRLKENQGHGNARRVSLQNCSNELVAIMDADDISISDRFERLLRVFEENSEVCIVGGQIAEFIEDEGNFVGKRLVPIDDAEIKKYMQKRCPMNLVTVMFKKSSVEEVGGFVDWYCEEDYYLWVRMAQAEMKFANVPNVLVNVRVGKDMYARRGGMKYYRSEKRLQKYMRKNKIIGFGTYIMNVTERFILQVLMPNKLRGWIFRKFAREK